MSKKDYEGVAAVLAGAMPSPTTKVIARGLANYFARENPAFKRDVFLRAVGMSESKDS
jgi:hypothetical protein